MITGGSRQRGLAMPAAVLATVVGLAAIEALASTIDFEVARQLWKAQRTASWRCSSSWHLAPAGSPPGLDSAQA